MQGDSSIVTGLAKIGLYLRSEGWRQADASGLTPTQAQILAYLAARGPARVGAIAAEIGVTQPTASDALAALLRKRQVERRPDPHDARATWFRAMAAGRRTARALAVWPDTMLAVVDALDAAERGAFLRALTKMIRSLQVQGAIPVQRMCATCRFFRPNAHDGAAAPHHCAFVDAAFGDAALRLDCGDHEPASEAEAAASWRRFAASSAGKADAPPADTGEAS